MHQRRDTGAAIWLRAEARHLVLPVEQAPVPFVQLKNSTNC